MRRLLILGAAALCLTGCDTIGGVAVPSAQTQLTIAETGIAIDATYNGAAQAYLAAAPTLDASTKAQAKALLIQARGYVVAADAAAQLGDATTLGEQIAAATSLITQAEALLPQKTN